VCVCQHRLCVSSCSLVSEEGQRIGWLPGKRWSPDDQEHQTERDVCSKDSPVSTRHRNKGTSIHTHTHTHTHTHAHTHTICVCEKVLETFLYHDEPFSSLAYSYSRSQSLSQHAFGQTGRGNSDTGIGYKEASVVHTGRSVSVVGSRKPASCRQSEGPALVPLDVDILDP